MNPTEYFGFGSIKNLKKILVNKKSKNIFLVRGKKSFSLSGAENILNQELRNYNVFSFYDFNSNPNIEEIIKGFHYFNQNKLDVIISVGGGSSIDVAKAIKLLHYNTSNKNIPLITIPTTSGSGSEATYFIVYYDNKEKKSGGIPDITLPNYTILDPQFLMSLPKYISASTGIDALSQAIESYWNINSTKESKEFAKKSIKIIIKNLENSVNNPSKKSKENMMFASNLAGKSINITKTTACHSISYPLTSYFNIAHGHAVGLSLGEMIVYNSNINKEDCLDKRGEDYVIKTMEELIFLLDSKNPKEAKNKIDNLMESIGLKTKLSDLGIKYKDLEVILNNGFKPERMGNNPRELTKEELKKVLNNIL